MLISLHNPEFSELQNFLFWGCGGTGITSGMVVNKHLLKTVGTMEFSSWHKCEEDLVEHLENKGDSLYREEEEVSGVYNNNDKENIRIVYLLVLIN